MKNKTLTTAIIISLLIGWASAALYEAGTYFKPENTDVGFIIGQNMSWDLVLTNTENLTFNDGSTFITVNAISASPGNITIYNLTDNYINHTTDLNAETTFTWNGLDWSNTIWWKQYEDGAIGTTDYSAPLIYLLQPTTGNLIMLTPSEVTTTTLPIVLDDQQTEYMTKMSNGTAFQAAEKVYTDLIGQLFWGIVIGVIMFGFWLRTQNFTYSALVMLIMITVITTSGFISADLTQYIYAIGITMAAVMIYNLASPQKMD